MMLKRYSIQWRSALDGWRYWNDKRFWTRRGVAKVAVKLAAKRRSLCTWRVMKNVKGRDEELLLIHRTANPPYCNCPAGRDGKRTRKQFPK